MDKDTIAIIADMFIISLACFLGVAVGRFFTPATTKTEYVQGDCDYGEIMENVMYDTGYRNGYEYPKRENSFENGVYKIKVGEEGFKIIND